MASHIEIKGNKGYLFENDYIFLQGLDLELSFMQAGVEFTQSYMRGRWDGRTRLLKSNLSFPAGLVPRIIDFYKQSNKEIKVVDKNVYEELTPINISERLKKINKEPRQYQIDAANKALSYKRGIIRSCTGSGKTLIAALIAAAVGKNTIIYVIGKDLLWQFHSFFEDVFQTEIGMIGDGVVNIKKITIASIWTVSKAFGMGKNKVVLEDDERLSKEKEIKEEYYDDIKKFVHASVVNIFDEVHLAAAETAQRIAAEMSGIYSIGLSASPYRDDKCDLLIEAVFGKVIVNISASELIKQGYLVEPTIKFIPVSKPVIPGSNYREIYKNYIVNNNERNELIVRGAISLIEQGFVTMILFKELAHGEMLYNMLQEKGIHCQALTGNNDSDTRKEVIKEVTSGKCKLLLASTIFDIGIDLPNLSGLIICGGGKSSIRAIQRIGRVLRPYPNKKMAAIIDFHDKAKYLREHYLIRKKIYCSEPGFNVLE